MKPLSDQIVARLRTDLSSPDLTGTRYTLVHHLARGGMGSVWLAEDTVLERQVALKVLDPIAPSGDLAARLRQEGRILAGLEHPGIVPVHDAGTLADGRAFYCMKYVEGQTLAEYISGKSQPDRLRLLERIVEPVSFAHARGVIHRDLKPENIMIGAFGEVLVMDWGLAKVGGAGLNPVNTAAVSVADMVRAASPVTGHGGVLGTPGYMSPEQARGDSDVDQRTDIFSLGAILLFLAAGSPPTAGMLAPRPVLAICHKAMAADRNQRYHSTAEMTADLARYLDGAPVGAYSENLLERAARIYNRHSTAVILVAIYLLMRLLFILWSRR